MCATFKIGRTTGFRRANGLVPPIERIADHPSWPRTVAPHASPWGSHSEAGGPMRRLARHTRTMAGIGAGLALVIGTLTGAGPAKAVTSGHASFKVPYNI